MRLCLSADLQPLAAQAQADLIERGPLPLVLSPDAFPRGNLASTIRGPGFEIQGSPVARLYEMKTLHTLRPMAICPECYPCLERLLGLAVELATPDPEGRRQVLASARRLLDQEFGPEAIPAAIANRILPAIYRLSGNRDPFAARKAAATAWAARMHQRLAPAYGDDLESLLRLAAAGNALDFFRGEAEAAREMAARVEFDIAAVSAFRRELAGPPGLILYLADNAGEQFFDQPLVASLRARGWRVVYTVKAGPIQNDLTVKDLEASGLLDALEPVVDTGASHRGVGPEPGQPRLP